jgi:hypothetical protein
MATDLGGYFVRVAAVMPGKLGRNPRSSAFRRVERAGEKKVAWANATSSGGVADWTAATLWRKKGGSESAGGSVEEASGDGVSEGLTMLMFQRPVEGVRTPSRMRSSFRVTMTDVPSKVTTHPASHNCPMESREAVLREGTMWTRRADGGRLGESSSASCVEYISVPLGSAMPMGWVAGRLFMTAAETVQK